jgi:uncharacterized SAM-binding protein YcdF (DUF218 family)
MKPRRLRLRRLLLSIVVAIVAVVIGVPALGRYLVVDDPLEPSDAIFVLEGGTPAREVEAAALYRRGLAPRVVLSRARDPVAEARRLAGEPTPQERSARAVEHAGVPAAAVVKLERVVDNTEQELAADFEYGRAHGFRRVIFVTSPSHTRRVRLIWDARYQSRLPARVTPTSYERFDARRWWRSRQTLEEGLHELVGIAHFFIGSPLPTYDRTHE